MGHLTVCGREGLSVTQRDCAVGFVRTPESCITHMVLRLAAGALYYVFKVSLFPFNWLWSKWFATNLRLAGVNKVVMVGASGGEGKHTVSRRLHERYGFHYIHIDACKFGPNWERYSDDQFRVNVNAQMCDRCVVAGSFSDPKCPAQQGVMESLMCESDLVVWNDIPRWVSVWRKAFRSFKRFIGVVPIGAAPETLKGVTHMLRRTAREFDARRDLLEDFWATEHRQLVRATWPHYYTVA